MDSDTESGSQAQRTSTPRSFLKRFKLRDVQATFGNLKRTVTHRTTRRDPPAPPQPTETEPDLPPFKELYLQKQDAETVLKELHEEYFEPHFDPVEFQLQHVEDNVGQEELDAEVEQLTAALEVHLTMM